jgi:hypothetical protein
MTKHREGDSDHHLDHPDSGIACGKAYHVESSFRISIGIENMFGPPQPLGRFRQGDSL